MSTVYEIGPLRLDVEAGVLTHDGVPVALGSRAVAVLRVLVDRPNEYVSKAHILEAAWPGLVVEESNLAVQISAIRHALAHVPGGARWIETLARRGYRFVGPITELRTPDRSAGGQRSNLPLATTSFVGRERELVEIKRLLPAKRLITLVGFGGIGKTRLALEVAAEVVDAYRDGAWLVDLAPIADPSLVASAAAQVLGIREPARSPPLDTLGARLARRQLLLVVDNCEHVRAACARLAEVILGAAPHVTILATSREALQVAGEQIYTLPTLSLPDPASSVDVLGRSEAVQLFIERAQAQQPDFALTAPRARIIADLCIHLDGIPLALELAAARIRSLSVEQIGARIDNRFRLLTGGSRLALPRQQTLRATFDWSYDLLAEDERIVLRRLAIFSGAFTLEAASAIASDDAIDDYAVIDLLSQLVGRSLVMADTTGSGARYRLLETTRAYALEKLADAEDSESTAVRHARYFVTRFEQAADDWLRMSDAEWSARYFLDLDNVRAALDWAQGDDGDSALGIALAGASGALWTELSLAREGRQRLEAAASRAAANTAEADLARLWRWLGSLLEAAPDHALPACERAIASYRRLGDVQGLGLALTQMGAHLTYLGRTEHAASLFAEAYPLLERAAPPKALADYFLQYGAMKMLSGDLRGARIYYENALALCRKVGADRMALLALMYLADMTWAEGDLDAALARFRETVELARRSPLRRLALGFCLMNLAGVHAERGELAASRDAAREGIPLLQEQGQLSLWMWLDHLALLAARAGRAEDAARIAGCADATRVAKQSPRQPNEVRARERLAALLKASLPSGQLESLLALGATLSDEDAVRLALKE